MNLYIYAYPAQIITFQLVDNNGKILINENCIFEDIVKTANKYLNSEEPIYNFYIIGNTPFADRILITLKNVFNNKVNIERIENA